MVAGFIERLPVEIESGFLRFAIRGTPVAWTRLGPYMELVDPWNYCSSPLFSRLDSFTMRVFPIPFSDFCGIIASLPHLGRLIICFFFKDLPN